MWEFGWRIDGRLLARAKQVCQLTKRRPHIDEPEPGNGATGVVTGEKRRERRRPLHEIVALPKTRPRNQHQEQTRFEEQCDE